MDVKDRLTRWALRRPHVLLVVPSTATTTGWDVEAQLWRRRWPVVAAPADADLLLTVGDCGSGLTGAADVLWAQVPRPRHRAHLAFGHDVTQTLDDAAAALLEPAANAPGPEPAAHDDHRTGGNAEHDMGADVAGLPMAGGGPDRDGLELDALTVHLGPVLPGWPTGLVVRATMQGDVLTDVHASVLDAAAAQPRHAERAPHEHTTLHALEHLERFLVVAGWSAAARDARRLRCGLWQAPGSTPDLTRAGLRLTRAIRRSRTLAWATRDLRGALPRVHAWCEVVEHGLGDATTTPPDPLPLAELFALVTGLDVGSARLVVASLPLTLVDAQERSRS